MYDTIECIKSWRQNDAGWYVCPEDNQWVKLGDWVTLGNRVKLGNWVTSLELAQQFRDLWKLHGETVIFTKWVTKDRMSPNFDGGTPLKYEIGEVVEVFDCKADDQQCAEGLHVLDRGHRPEWYGLCNADHDYIPLDVEVNTDDFLFGGLPTMTGKYRVRKLKVLNQPLPVWLVRESVKPVVICETGAPDDKAPGHNAKPDGRRQNINMLGGVDC